MRCRAFLALWLLAFLALAPRSGSAQGVITQPRLHIYAGPLHKEYLGCLNCDQYDVSSIWDGYGPMGWDNGYIALSHFNAYFVKSGQYSACDAYAKDPPILIDRSRKEYGRLNISRTRSDSVCGPHGSADVCQKLQAKCDSTAGITP